MSLTKHAAYKGSHPKGPLEEVDSVTVFCTRLRRETSPRDLTGHIRCKVLVQIMYAVSPTLLPTPELHTVRRAVTPERPRAYCKDAHIKMFQSMYIPSSRRQFCCKPYLLM
jgi:hypothetical protein